MRTKFRLAFLTRTYVLWFVYMEFVFAFFFLSSSSPLSSHSLHSIANFLFVLFVLCARLFMFISSFHDSIQLNWISVWSAKKNAFPLSSNFIFWHLLPLVCCFAVFAGTLVCVRGLLFKFMKQKYFQAKTFSTHRYYIYCSSKDKWCNSELPIEDGNHESRNDFAKMKFPYFRVQTIRNEVVIYGKG